MINSKIFNTLILVLTFLIGKGQPEGKPDIRKVYDNLDLVGGSMLTNAYYFFTPDIRGLIPFDQNQMELIKRNNIRKIEALIYPRPPNHKTFYFFNAQGQLIKEETGISGENGFIEVEEEVHYRYCSQGRITGKRRTSKDGRSVDTLAYDTQGRLIFYDSFYEYYSNGNFVRDTIYHLRFIEYGENYVKLVDTRVGQTDLDCYYYFDRTNQVFKHFDLKGKSDSLVRFNIDSNNTEKLQFWYKGYNNKSYCLGQEVYYKNGQIIAAEVWETLRRYPQSEKFEFVYDSKNRLIRIGGESFNPRRVFIIYDDDGLVIEQIRRHDSQIWHKKFKYYRY